MRRRWRKQQSRNFRSRAIGGPSRSRPGNGKCGKAFCFPLHTASVWLFRSDRKTRGIAACRCQWQMQAGRNFRSRAIGGPLRSRPGNGNCGKVEERKPERFFASPQGVCGLARGGAFVSVILSEAEGSRPRRKLDFPFPLGSSHPAPSRSFAFAKSWRSRNADCRGSRRITAGGRCFSNSEFQKRSAYIRRIFPDFVPRSFIFLPGAEDIPPG